VEALVTFCARIGATVIAEGIERPEELEFLCSTGVSLGQGYLLAGRHREYSRCFTAIRINQTFS